MTPTPTPKTDQELKLALAKMLPEKISCEQVSLGGVKWFVFVWGDYSPILETEWLHVCWLLEHGLRYKGNQFQWLDYTKELFSLTWARTPRSDDCICDSTAWDVICQSWQCRALALCRVKGIEP